MDSVTHLVVSLSYGGIESLERNTSKLELLGEISFISYASMASRAAITKSKNH